MDQYSRTALLIGDDNLKKLWDSHVAIFGIGGVGGNVLESLARMGVGHFTIIDDDLVCLTNINRQILATRKTYGKRKIDVAEERVHEINPNIIVEKTDLFYLPEEKDKFDFTKYDYIVDAIDTITAKIDIIMEAKRVKTPIISAMGCGNRVDPTKLVLTDIYNTSGDPLSKVMRHELKKRNIKDLKVVYSTEPPIKPDMVGDKKNSCLYNCVCPKGTKRTCLQRRDIPGSTSFVPPVAGTLIAYQVFLDLTKFDSNKIIKEQREQKLKSKTI